MPTKTKARQLGLFEGHPWPNNNTSDFEYNSPPSSPTLSSGYESIISEDLDLYDPRCVCQLVIESYGLKCERV